MLYFIHGTDISKSADKTKSLIDAMLKKKPDASIFKLTYDNWDTSQFQELLVGQALFENKYIVQLSRLLDDKDAKEVVLDSLKEIKESDNIFVWLEGMVDKKSLTQIEKYSEKVQFFNLSQEKVKRPEFNIFSLGDAMGSRDKKKLWMLYQDAKNHFAIEEIHGKLFWQAKSMLLASKTKSAEDAGLKPFVYTKSVKLAKNFSEDELQDLSSRLISISHDARRGIHNFDIALERFCLEV